jgi:hypothetical protein
VGLPRSVNDSKVLRRCTIYYFADYQGLFNANKGQEGFSPFLLGDKGYPLLSWLMTPPKEGNHNLFEMLYNRKHKQVRFVIENVFGVLKKIFHELQRKIEMHINFAPNYITCCCLLHNLLICHCEIVVEQISIVLDEEDAATQNFITQDSVVAIKDGETSSEQ